MSRCAYCRGFIWPWQRRGWRVVGTDGARRRWHGGCWQRLRHGPPAALQPDPDPLTTSYIEGYGDGWDDGVRVEGRRSPLRGFVIVAVASALLAGLITAAVVHAAAPRPVSAPPVPAQGRTGVPLAGVAQLVERGNRAEAAGSTPVPGLGAPLSPAGSLARTSQPVTGKASWYVDPSKPIDGLYGAVPGWHYGDQPYALRVTAGSRSVVVLIGDCLCGGIAGRVVDLSAAAFSRLAPLAAGVVRVSIERVAVGPESPPPTDVGP